MSGRRADALYPHLLPLAFALDPENTGGAMLLGVDGVCVISHGSSSSVAIVNAITVAHDLAVGRSGRCRGRLGDAGGCPRSILSLTAVSRPDWLTG